MLYFADDFSWMSINSEGNLQYQTLSRAEMPYRAVDYNAYIPSSLETDFSHYLTNDNFLQYEVVASGGIHGSNAIHLESFTNYFSGDGLARPVDGPNEIYIAVPPTRKITIGFRAKITGYGDSTYMQMGFYVDAVGDYYRNFGVDLRNGGGKIVADILNHDDYDYGEQSSIAVPIPSSFWKQYHLYEVHIDMTNASAGGGRFAVAIDGVVVADENRATGRYNEWNGSGSLPRCFIDTIVLGAGKPDSHVYPGHYAASSSAIDSLYVLTGNNNWQYEPLLDAVVTRCPLKAGSQDFMSQVFDDKQVEDGVYDSGKLISSDDLYSVTSYPSSRLEAYFAGIKELFRVDLSDIDTINTEIHGIVSMFAYNRIANTSVNQRFALMPVVKHSGRELFWERSLEVEVDDYVARFFVWAYGLAPDLACAWTWDLLENFDFGFLVRDKNVGLTIEEYIGIADSSDEE